MLKKVRSAIETQSDLPETANRRAFVDFVEGLLNLDPIQRWTPQQAAKHPFITGEKFTGPFQVSCAH
jgi:dual specificity protein kinase YAK1